MNNKKGFTLIEIMLAIGIISMGSVGIYHVGNKATEWVNINTEVSNLNTTFNRLEGVVSAVGVFTNIDKKAFESMYFPVSKFKLVDVVSPKPDKLHLSYTGVNDAACSKITSNIIKRFNISAIINNTEIKNGESIEQITQSCNGNPNDLTVVVSTKPSVSGLTAVIPTSMIAQTTSLSNQNTLSSNVSSKSTSLSIVSIPGVTSPILNADEVVLTYNSTKLYQFGIALPAAYQNLPYQLVLTQSDGTVLSNWAGTASSGIMNFSYNYQGPFNDGMFGNRPYESVKLAVLIQESGVWKQITSKTTKLRK